VIRLRKDGAVWAHIADRRQRPPEYCAGTAKPSTGDVCDCHEWYDVAEIGEWYPSLLGGRASMPKLAREIVATEDIWNRSEMSHDDLMNAILAAGRRIGHGYALNAWTLEDGRVSLNNGLHRWAVATELGITRVPVEMHILPSEPAWASP
jgi:hypothetical protein